ncbi:MAG TPA: hypothetical protein PJ994_11820, partial [Tepidiformaceae bacterium]|nr:hypothetical protein [Tepidiformaceae bacterium]
RHTGSPAASLAIAEELWSDMTVAGGMAAVASPIFPDIGLGQGAVVTYRDGVLTLVHTNGIPLADLLAFAEELLE